MSDIVHARVYDPHRAGALFKVKANEKPTCTVIHCSNKDNCGLHARGECAMLAMLDSRYCPYGRMSYKEGPTKRSKNYRKWVSDMESLYKDSGRLNNYTRKMAIVGDHVFLPYAHMNMNKDLPFKNHGHFMSSGTHFLELSGFDVDAVFKIINFSPQAMMGGTITTYYREVVPMFLLHLKEVMPDLYRRAVETNHTVENIVSDVSNVGRQALLSSLAPGTVILQYHKNKDLKTRHWVWDGATLTSTDSDPSFMPVGFEECTITLRPKADQYVDITSEDQVNSDTRYKI